MKSLLEHMKAINSAHITEVRDNRLWYKVFFQEREAGGSSWQLDVGIPVDDLKGAVFTASMYEDDPETTNPKHLQRWIRQALEEKKVLEEAISEGRKARDAGYIQCGCGFTHKTNDRCGP